MEIKEIVACSDKYRWALQPYIYLHNKYWSELQPAMVALYTPPEFTLPRNFRAKSIAIPEYPKEKWADGVMKFLADFNEDFFILMLEDYWLTRTVNHEAINCLADYMDNHRDVIRMDLTSDRQYAGNMRDVDTWGHYDIIEARHSQYQMSLQAGIWNKLLFGNVISRLGENFRSAWDVELNGTTVIDTLGYRVLGTRQQPIRYCNGMNNAISDKANFSGLSDVDINEIKMMIPKKYYE